MGGEYVLVDITVQNRLRGQKTGFYLYNGKTVEYFEQDVPHIYCSRWLEGQRDQEEFRKQILSDNELKHANLEVKLIGTNRVQVVGDRGYFKKLQEATNFRFTEASIDRMVLFRYPIFSKVRIADGRLVNTGATELKDILNANFATIDLETFGNSRESSLPIYLAEMNDSGVKVSNQNLERLVGLGTVEDGEMAGNRFFWGVQVAYDKICHEGMKIGSLAQGVLLKKLIALEGYASKRDDFEMVVGDKSVFGKETLREFKERGVIFPWGHHIKGFDLKHLKSWSEMGKDYPRFKGGGSFLKDISSFPGFQVGDSLAFARNYLGPLPRYTLEWTCRMLGIKFKKSLGHGELNELLKNPTPENIETAVSYLMDGDIEAQYKIAEILTEPVLRIAYAYKEPFTRVSNQREGLAKDYRSRRYFERFQTARHDRSLELSEFDYYGELNKILMDDWASKKTSKGVFKNVKVVKPLLGVNHLMLRKENAIDELVNLAKSSDNPIFRLIYSRAAEAYSEEPLLDYTKVENRDRRMYDERFSKRYGVDYYKLKNALKDDAKASEIPFLNFSRDFLFVPEGTVLPEGKYLEIFVADEIISPSKGRVIAKIGDRLISPGIDLAGIRGLHIGFADELYADAADIYFEKGWKPALDYLKLRMSQLNSGKIPVKDLAIFIKRNQEAYSSSAYGRLDVKLMKEIGLQSGEEAMVVLSDLENYRTILFGPRGKNNKRALSKGNISDLFTTIIPKHKTKELYSAIDAKINHSLDEWAGE